MSRAADSQRSQVLTGPSPSPFQTIDLQSAAISPRTPARALVSRLTRKSLSLSNSADCVTPGPSIFSVLSGSCGSVTFSLLPPAARSGAMCATVRLFGAG